MEFEHPVASDKNHAPAFSNGVLLRWMMMGDATSWAVLLDSGGRYLPASRRHEGADSQASGAPRGMPRTDAPVEMMRKLSTTPSWRVSILVEN